MKSHASELLTPLSWMVVPLRMARLKMSSLSSLLIPAKSPCGIRPIAVALSDLSSSARP